MPQLLRLSYASSVSDFAELNSSFDTGKLRVAYTGGNRNGSYISKETYEKCIETIFNCPVVCNYNREEDSIGGHDFDIVCDDEGTVRIVNVTTPVGVIPESAQYSWETVKEEDGSEHEYLDIDVLLWKRQEAYKKIRDDGIVAESMEIQVKDGAVDKKTGLYIINDFEFNAFCLLGEDVEPCFESASLEVFSRADLKTQIEQMMTDLKGSLTPVTTSDEADDIHPQNNYSMEGGKVLDEKLALIAEYGLTIDELDFAIDDFSMDELKEKLEGLKPEEGGSTATDATFASNEEEEIVDVDDEGSDASVPADQQNKFELNSELRKVIHDTLSAEVVMKPWGEERRYWLRDYDEELQMVYADDMSDGHLYGFPYSKNGDNVVIDYENGKRMKYAIVEFDEGEQVNPFADILNRVGQKYQAASDTINSMNDELTELRQFKNDTEEAVAQAERDEVFAQFGELVGVEAFDTLRENCSDLTAEDLQEKCFAIRGRIAYGAKFSYEPKAPKLKVTKEAGDNSQSPSKKPYGGIVEKYLGIQE